MIYKFTTIQWKKFFYTFLVGAMVVSMNFVGVEFARAATITWDGGGVNNSWSNAFNWSPDGVPGSGDLAVFDGTSAKDVTLTSNVTVGGISIGAYGGTFTQGIRTLTIRSQGFAQSGGTFLGSSTATMTVDGDFAITGGTFSAPNKIIIRGDWDHSGGIFTHNNGTVHTDDLSGVDQHIFTGETTFYNLRTDPGSDAPADYQFEDGTTQTIEGTAFLSLGPVENMDHGVRMSISSTSPGVAASLDFQGDVQIVSAEIQDITILGDALNCRARCSDNGGNTNIDFTESIDIYVSEMHGETTEAGGTAWFDIYLTSRPLSDVTIPVVSSNPAEGTPSTALLTFTSANFETAQTVTITGVDDAVDDGTIAYAIELGPTSSGDARFDGFVFDDLPVNNQDDDVTEDGFGFDYMPHFDMEDVRDVAGEITTFWASDGQNGLGWVYDAEGSWGEVDISNSKIQPGCAMSLEGEEYTLSGVYDEAIFSRDVTLTLENDDGGKISERIDAITDFVTGVDIDYVQCHESEGGVLKLRDGFAMTDYVTGIDYTEDMVFDPDNNKVFVPIEGSFDLEMVDLDTVTSTPSPLEMTQAASVTTACAATFGCSITMTTR